MSNDDRNNSRMNRKQFVASLAALGAMPGTALFSPA